LFKQKKGIPQGSFLSTLLCSLFYGQFDKDTGLIDFPSDDLVMRYVDDFLIISPCRERLERFAKYLQGGFPEFGIKINGDKTRFSCGSEIFTWCGLRINPETLDISPDYSNFENTSKTFDF
jgi:telomerase reverse transcriptase